MGQPAFEWGIVITVVITGLLNTTNTIATLKGATVYRIALPVLLGLSIMSLPATTFTTIPQLVRPILSNGMLMGILVTLFIEFLYYVGHKNHMKL